MAKIPKDHRKALFLNGCRKHILLTCILILIFLSVSCSGSQNITTNNQNNSDDSKTDIKINTDNYKIFLDTDVKTLTTVIAPVTYEVLGSGGAKSVEYESYLIVEYTNIIPYASGIEIFTQNGQKLRSIGGYNGGEIQEAHTVLTSLAWREAAVKITPGDMQTLQGVLQTSQQIDNMVSPVYSITRTATSSISSLQGFCANIPIVGKKCAWDIVTSSYPGVNEFSNELISFDNELSEWKNAASSVNKHLPIVIDGLRKAKEGGDISQLQGEISQSLSAFGSLQSKTKQMSGKLSSMSSSLTRANSGFQSASSNSVLGYIIKPVSNTISSMANQVDSLRSKTDTFSSTMEEQSSKLSAVTSYANNREAELYSKWNARQNASFRVYGTIIFLILLILLTLGSIQYNKKLKAQGKTFELSKFLQFNKNKQIESPHTLPGIPFKPQGSERNISTSPKRLKVLSSKKPANGTSQRLKVKSSKNSDDKLP